jgi:hypothetical protein
VRVRERGDWQYVHSIVVVLCRRSSSSGRFRADVAYTGAGTQLSRAEAENVRTERTSHTRLHTTFQLQGAGSEVWR